MSELTIEEMIEWCDKEISGKVLDDGTETIHYRYLTAIRAVLAERQFTITDAMIKELAFFRVLAARSSIDAPAFDYCVKAEIEELKAAIKLAREAQGG